MLSGSPKISFCIRLHSSEYKTLSPERSDLFALSVILAKPALECFSPVARIQRPNKTSRHTRESEYPASFKKDDISEKTLDPPAEDDGFYQMRPHTKDDEFYLMNSPAEDDKKSK